MSGAKLDDAHHDSHQGRHQSSGYRRIELITGEARRGRGRRRRSPGFWPRASSLGPRLPPLRRHGMNRSLLWNWRHEARKRGADGERSFVPIRVMDAVDGMPSCDALEAPATAGCGPVSAGDVSAGAVTGTIEIEMGGARVRVSGVVDAAALRQVLSHLRRKP